MKVDNLVLSDNKLTSLYQILNCNLVWIMKLDVNNSLNLIATDQAILKYYWKKKYYLQDPLINTKPNKNAPPWNVTLGTDCKAFNKSGFLYDLYKMFEIEEFISVEKRTETERYCFRFFTKNNRFVFMNKILNNMPIIKYFMNNTSEKFKTALHKQPGINITKLKRNNARP